MAATRLNPLSKYSYQMGIVYFAMRRYHDAVQALKTICDPIDLIYAWLAAALANSGQQVEAEEAAARFEADFSAHGASLGEPAMTYLAVRFPFRTEEDQEHFASGLKRAGIA